MIYKEIQGNLFDADEKYYLAHCISADYALGAGIATEFVKRFNMREKLQKVGHGKYPDCILIDRVFNLVTKNIYWYKPTYHTLRAALEYMQIQMVDNKIKYLAIPKIGCGIDGLEWESVREIIKDIFGPEDIEIVVYYL